MLQVIEVVLGRKIQAQKELFAHMVNHLNMALLSKDENDIEESIQQNNLGEIILQSSAPALSCLLLDDFSILN